MKITQEICYLQDSDRITGIPETAPFPHSGDFLGGG
jgi:hypothetical protein